jgi:hypothetical protein
VKRLTRREFLGRTAAGATAAGFMLTASGTASANPLGLPIGSQTYPHRAMIADGKFVDRHLRPHHRDDGPKADRLPVPDVDV